MRCVATHEYEDKAALVAMGPPGAGCENAARRIYRLAERFEEFSLDQLQRLERVLAHCGEILHQESTLREMMTSVQEERTCWEQQRQQELRRMQEETTRLLEAWTLLENEQRRLLAHRSGQPAACNPQNTAARPNQPGMHLGEPVSVTRALPAESVVDSAAGSGRQAESQNTAEAVNVDTALLQFQQLRRELQKHAQHRHPKRK